MTEARAIRDPEVLELPACSFRMSEDGLTE